MLTGSRSLSIRSALIMVFVNRYAMLAINVSATMLLARLLTPAETGLFSIAASVVLLAQAIRDFGIAEFLVQERDLTSAKIRTAFGLTLILSWSLGAVILLARHTVARLYGTPELAGLIAIVAGSFAVAPFSSTVLALLNREMAFGTLFRITLASTVANQTVSITLALFGWGAAALTFGMLAANIATALVASLSLRSWDHVIPSLREWRALASFGAYISGANIVNQIGARTPDLIIGRLLGYQSLGLYNRACGIVGMFSELVVVGVQAVAFPAFSGAHRAGEDVRAPYLRTVTLVSGVMLPVLAMLAIMAGPIVQTLLGDQWKTSAALVPLLCGGAAFDALSPMVVPFLNATGRVAMVPRIALATRGTQLLLVAGLAGFGLTWLAAGQIVLGVAGLLINVHFLRRAIRVRLADLLLAVQRSAAVAGLTVVLPLLVLAGRAGAHDPAWLTLGLGLGLGGIAWIAAILALRHPLGREFAALLREMRLIVRRRVA
jgi:O-antigen/teichoic acid export membrane protein